MVSLATVRVAMPLADPLESLHLMLAVLVTITPGGEQPQSTGRPAPSLSIIPESRDWSGGRAPSNCFGRPDSTSFDLVPNEMWDPRQSTKQLPRATRRPAGRNKNTGGEFAQGEQPQSTRRAAHTPHK